MTFCCFIWWNFVRWICQFSIHPLFIGQTCNLSLFKDKDLKIRIVKTFLSSSIKISPKFLAKFSIIWFQFTKNFYVYVWTLFCIIKVKLVFHNSKFHLTRESKVQKKLKIFRRLNFSIVNFYSVNLTAHFVKFTINL